MPGATRQDMGAVRKTEIWVGGEYMYAITNTTDGKNENERSYVVFGNDENLTDRKTVNGTLELTSLTRAGEFTLKNMLMGYAPDASSVLEVDPDAGESLPVWFNFREPDDTDYMGARYFGSWSPSPVAGETAGPEDVSQRNFMGSCARPVDIDNGFIYSENVTIVSGSLGYSGTCTYNGYKPANSSNYCLDIVAISGTGNGIRFSSLQNAAGLLNASGQFVIDANRVSDLPREWSGKMTAALVIKAGTGSGTFKTSGDTPIPTDSAW